MDKNKEEILAEEWSRMCNNSAIKPVITPEMPYHTIEPAKAAMDVYAKQEAISFAHHLVFLKPHEKAVPITKLWANFKEENPVHSEAETINEPAYAELRKSVLEIEKYVRGENIAMVISLLSPLLQKLENYRCLQPGLVQLEPTYNLQQATDIFVDGFHHDSKGDSKPLDDVGREHILGMRW